MASWADDQYDRGQERDWEKYERPDAEMVEEAQLRMQVEDERRRQATTGGVVKK